MACIFLCWIQWYFWKFSTTIIKDLYTNKVNCAKQKNIQKYHGALLPLLYHCISFLKSYGTSKCITLRSWATLEINSGYTSKNIGFLSEMSANIFKDFIRYWRLCMQKELFCAPQGRLRRPRFTSLAISRIYGLVQFLLTNNGTKTWLQLNDS